MSFLGEVLAEILREVVVGIIFGKKKTTPQFPEGEGNASLGALSLFFGGLALIFSLIFFASGLNQNSFNDIVGNTSLTILFALIAFFSGRRASNVTQRNLGMARVGTYFSLLAICLSLVILAICTAKAFQWMS